MAGATGTGSVIGLRAKHIRLGDENLVAMDVSGGKVQFYGDVQVGSLPVQDYSNMIPDAGLTDINNWVSDGQPGWAFVTERSEEHTSELQSLMRISYAVFCLKKKREIKKQKCKVRSKNKYSSN